MAKNKFVWKVPPGRMVNQLEKHKDRILSALLGIGEKTSAELQNEARQDANWEDRTGNARTGLMGTARKDGEVVIISLAHTVEYGVYLEHDYGGRYAIIVPTINGNIPRLRKTLKAVFG